MRRFALLLGLAVLACVAALVAQEREGNFSIRLEPTAVLQAGTEVPFQITVVDPRQRPVEHAQVKLEIKDRDNMNLRDFRAVMTAPGVYIAKPTFLAGGEWSLLVEARRDQELTTRTMQVNVAE